MKSSGRRKSATLKTASVLWRTKRYLVKNGNDPTSGNITEEKESELEEFIDNAEIVMGTLGHKVFLTMYIFSSK